MNKWSKVSKEELAQTDVMKRSLTYWEDVWRRLKQNKLTMFGLIVIVLVVLMAIFAPFLTKYTYEEQKREFSNIPPRFEIYQADENYIYVHNDYKLFEVSEKGDLLRPLEEKNDDFVKKQKSYELDGQEIILDYSYASSTKTDKKFAVIYSDNELDPLKKVSNNTYLLGTDKLGRDLWTRILYGARISLIVALAATVVNFFIGIAYGGISGYFGGTIDSLMMRFVDLISTIPLLLYVILLMVVLGGGLKTIILAIGLTYWVRMARIVRGQTLSIKNHEYVLAARALGARNRRILFKHIIPNAMGPIIVSATMMIPSAIFTEAFLSFIGLGISAPQASWGTLADEGLSGILSYPYQLIFPSIAISITMLAFNFLGDGLRDALDPKLRK